MLFNKEINGMKKIYFLILFLLVLLLVGCVTGSFHRTMDKPGGETIVDEPLNGPESEPKSAFVLSTEGPYPEITLSYTQGFRRSRETSVQRVTYEVSYSRFLRLFQKETSMREKSRETIINSTVIDKISKTLLPEDGSEVVLEFEQPPKSYSLSVYNPTVVRVKSVGGKVVFDEELQALILNSAKDVDHLNYLTVKLFEDKRSRFSSFFPLKEEFDFSNVGFVISALAEVNSAIESLPKSPVDSLQAYAKYIDAVVGLKPRLKFGIQTKFLIKELASKYEAVFSSLYSEELTIAADIPEFIISGDIVDTSRGGTEISIWGIALPSVMGGSIRQSEGRRTRASNISVHLVSGETKMRSNNKQIQFLSGLYYLFTDSGENNRGQSVPIYVYSDVGVNAEQQSKINKLKSVRSQIDELKKLYNDALAKLQ
jgi:hypothetical protein